MRKKYFGRSVNKVVSLFIVVFILLGFFYYMLTPHLSNQKSFAGQKVVLFDDTKSETAGNADWVIDGAYSDWANALKDQGFAVRELSGWKITEDDLKGVSVFVIPEPQNPFTQNEERAIKDFVKNGGGLVIISDHAGADRNHSGYDAVQVFNETLKTSDFGITFDSDKVSEHPITNLNKKDFPEIFKGVNAVGIWGGATITLSGDAKPLVVSYQGSVAAASIYGSGKVVAIGDSSIFDDGSGDPGDKLYDNWDDYNDAEFGINIVNWCAIPVSATYPSGPDSPIHIHLSWKSDPRTTMVVTWQTKENHNVPAEVVYGITESYGETAKDNTWTYEGADGYIYSVELKGLKPGTTYHYRCGDDVGGWSKDYTFTTAPATDKATFNFVVMGDSRNKSPYDSDMSNWGKVVKGVLKVHPKFVVFTGDNVYIGGDQSFWNIWFNYLEPLSATAPFMEAVGNHEYHYRTAEPWVNYLKQFVFPNNNLWYSFNYGSIHFISLSTDSDYRKGSPQYKWLVSDLQNIKKEHPDYWIIVAFHRPPFTFVGASDMSVRETLCPLFDKYKVNLVYNGHEHDYERTYPINAEGKLGSKAKYEYCGQNYPIYVVDGCAGAPQYGASHMYWTVYSENGFGFTEITASYDELKAKHIRIDGTVSDSFVIKRSCGVPTPKNLNAVPFAKGISLHWGPVDYSKLAGYSIYRGTSPGGEDFANPIATVDKNTTSYKDTSVEIGKKYYYVVKAFDNGNPPDYSAPSNEVEAEIADNTPPVVKIVSPQDGETVNEQYLTIKGSVYDEGSGIKDVFINGNITILDKDGNFETSVSLHKGENTITIVATDKAGNKTTKTITVIYKPQIVITLKPNNPYMTVNGVEKEIDPGRGTKPVIIPEWGRTVVPIRAIVEALGGTIQWDGKERKVTILFNDTTIELWIDKPQARVNGEMKWIDPKNHNVKPIIINDRTMLPLRFVAENLGCTVNWDPATRTITITYTPSP